MKKKSTLVVLLALEIVFGLVLVSGLLLFLWLGKIRRVDSSNAGAGSTNNSVISTLWGGGNAKGSATEADPTRSSAVATDVNALQAEDQEADWSKAETSVMNESVKNILLIGQDKRPGEDRARSDSMILCSLNTETNEITMISLMRDMYVDIPGFTSDKLNTAYFDGGMETLDATLEQSLNVHIDNNVEVDFDAFMKIIDDIGGIEMTLTKEEADYLNFNNTAMVDGIATEPWTLKVGKNNLDAQQALGYARMRYVGNSDWERTDRQRKVMKEIFKKISSMSSIRQLSLVNAVIPYVTTDMTNSEILGYAWTVLTQGMKLNAQSYRIPLEGTYYCDTIGDMEVLVPDLMQNAIAIANIINGEDVDITTSSSTSSTGTSVSSSSKSGQTDGTSGSYENQSAGGQTYSDQTYSDQTYVDPGYSDQTYSDTTYSDQAYDPGYSDQTYYDDGSSDQTYYDDTTYYYDDGNGY